MASEPNSTPASPATIPQVTVGVQPPEPRRGSQYVWFYQIVIGTLVFVLVFAALMGWQMSRAATFFSDAMQGAPITLAPIDLTPEEETGMKKMHDDYVSAYEAKKDFETWFTPRQLNDFVMRQMARQHEPGKTASNELILLQTGIEGDQTLLKGSFAIQDGRFFNFDARGDLAIKDGRIEWHLDDVKSGDAGAPWLAMKYMRNLMQAQITRIESPYPPGSRPDPARPEAAKVSEGTETFRMIKLFERDNGKFHLILNGANLKPPVENPAK